MYDDCPSIRDLKSFEENKRDEMWMFTRIPESIYVPVEILVDMDNAYKKFKHPLWLYFQDKYCEDSDYDYWVPITIEDVPTIPFDIASNRTFKIPQSKMNELAKWIIDNQKILRDIAHEEVNDITEALKASVLSHRLVEDYNFKTHSLLEMSKLQKSETGLPCDIYIDDTGSAEKTSHRERIKFDNGKSGSNPRNWPVITIYGKKRLIGSKGKLHDSDINKLISFVDYNKDNIIDIANQKIDLQKFKNVMVRIDKSGKFLIPSNKDYTFHSDARYNDYKIVYRNDDGLFNYIDNKGELLSDIWFVIAKPFKISNNKIIAYCETENGDMCYISPDGELTKLY